MSIGGGDCIANIWIRSDHGRLQQERNLVTGRIFSKRGNTGTGLDRIAIAPALVDLCWVHDTPGRYGGSGPSAHPRQRGIGRRTFLRTATTRSIATCWPSRRARQGRRPEKAKGRFLLREIALPVRICRRSGSASKSQCRHSEIIRDPRGKPAFPSFFQDHSVVRASLPPCIGFQLPGGFMGFVTDSLDGYSRLSSSGRSLFR
jgi:hypothetical protein